MWTGLSALHHSAAASREPAAAAACRPPHGTATAVLLHLYCERCACYCAVLVGSPLFGRAIFTRYNAYHSFTHYYVCTLFVSLVIFPVDPLSLLYQRCCRRWSERWQVTMAVCSRLCCSTLCMRRRCPRSRLRGQPQPHRQPLPLPKITRRMRCSLHIH